MATKNDLVKQLLRLRETGFADKLALRAQEHGFPAPYFFAIASRETNCVNELGDFQGGQFHGVGIIQIDIQHQIAREARDSGSWKTDPEPLLDFGADLIKNNIERAIQKFPAFTTDQQLKVAASGYNCGIQRAISGAQQGDSDKFTTGKNYGQDVMTRMAIFQELLDEDN